MVIVGDVNIDWADTNDFYTNKLKGLIEEYDMLQLVDRPRRITNISESTIDLVLTNEECNVHVLDEPNVTDHSLILIEYLVRSSQN